MSGGAQVTAAQMWLFVVLRRRRPGVMLGAVGLCGRRRRAGVTARAPRFGPAALPVRGQGRLPQGSSPVNRALDN